MENSPAHQQDQAVSPSLSLEVAEEEAVVTAQVDCETARLEATKEAMSEAATFVPECSRGGAYLAVQCYRSEGYCWCVEPHTGRPIPGTSSTNNKPQCGHQAGLGGNTNNQRDKQWRKCEGEKREKFLTKLFDWMRRSVVNSTVPYLLNSEPHLSINQRLAKWQFISLDNNRNGVSVASPRVIHFTGTVLTVLTDFVLLQVLEKKEVKRWKKALREVSGLTLCGKRIQQYCDTNKDKRLSQTEWTKCLDVAMGKIKHVAETLDSSI